MNMNIPTNTKLALTKTDNFDIISDRLDWLWKHSWDVYEFYTPEEIKLKLSAFVDELNMLDMNNIYDILQDIKSRNYYLQTNTGKFNSKIIIQASKNHEFNEPIFKTLIGNKCVLIDFQRNYLVEKAHSISRNSEKICNIYFHISFGTELYFVRFDRDSDRKIFCDINEYGKYVYNEMSKKIGYVQSGNFGGANEAFKCSDEGLKLVIEELVKNGYEVGFNNEKRR